MDKLKIEIAIILLSVLLLFGLGIRADLEGKLQGQEAKILELQRVTAIKNQRIVGLQKQLTPPPFSYPVDKIRVSSECGIRTDPLGGGTERLHAGLDLSGSVGDPVYAVLSGVVIENWLPPGIHNGIFYKGHPIMGGYIVISHKQGFFSLYGHLSASLVHENDFVEKGEQIGELGNTGHSTGPHLHFGIVPDPLKYLAERR